MDTSLDMTIREALHELDCLKSPDCLDDAAIGCYAENQVTDEERRQCEAHLHICLYCLDRLTDLQGLRYYQQHPVPVPDELLARLQSVIPPQEQAGKSDASVMSFGQQLRRLLTLPVTEWRYSATGLVGATLGALICFAIMGPERPGGSPPQSSRPGSSCVLLIFVSSLPPDFADDVTRRISRTPVVTGPSQNRAGAIYAHGSSHSHLQSVRTS